MLTNVVFVIVVQGSAGYPDKGTVFLGLCS